MAGGVVLCYGSTIHGSGFGLDVEVRASPNSESVIRQFTDVGDVRLLMTTAVMIATASAAELVTDIFVRVGGGLLYDEEADDCFVIHLFLSCGVVFHGSVSIEPLS